MAEVNNNIQIFTIISWVPYVCVWEAYLAFSKESEKQDYTIRKLFFSAIRGITVTWKGRAVFPILAILLAINSVAHMHTFGEGIWSSWTNPEKLLALESTSLGLIMVWRYYQQNPQSSRYDHCFWLEIHWVTRLYLKGIFKNCKTIE